MSRRGRQVRALVVVVLALTLAVALVDLMGSDSRIRAAFSGLVDREPRRPPVRRVLDDLRP